MMVNGQLKLMWTGTIGHVDHGKVGALPARSFAKTVLMLVD